MRIRTLEDRICAQCVAQGIIYNDASGLTPLTPSVIMFYGVKRDKGLVSMGQGKENTYLALIGQHITIELYENQIAQRHSS